MGCLDKYFPKKTTTKKQMRAIRKRLAFCARIKNAAARKRCFKRL